MINNCLFRIKLECVCEISLSFFFFHSSPLILKAYPLTSAETFVQTVDAHYLIEGNKQGSFYNYIFYNLLFLFFHQLVMIVLCSLSIQRKNRRYTGEFLL